MNRIMRLRVLPYMSKALSSNGKRAFLASDCSDFVVGEEVKHALVNRIPVVALESTIISHGMPYPKNLETALRIEDEIRKQGAIPATIAVIDGNVKVGLTLEELKLLAQASSVIKASRRDLAYAATLKATAGTTVASTMFIAHRAGIKVFATGGIGGVHRGAEMSMDISADLIELGQTPVCVVCAGVKSILDIPKTLEVLETNGVPVVSFNSDIFPAFFTNDSGVKSPLNLTSTTTIAEMMMNAEILGLNHGFVIGVPNPKPAETEETQKAINTALQLAAEQGITGAALTPFILQHIEKLTHGKSLEANISLVLNNAIIASKIAKDYLNIKSGLSRPPPAPFRKSSGTSNGSVVVVGGAVYDLVAKSFDSIDANIRTSLPGLTVSSFGGVGRNIAETLARLGRQVSLVSAVGDDYQGRALSSHARQLGVDTTNLLTASSRHHKTATYTAIHDKDGDLYVGIADMEIFKSITESVIQGIYGAVRKSKCVVVDGNLEPEIFATLVKFCHTYRVPVFFEPTSNHKCVAPIDTDTLHMIDIIKPNVTELEVMVTKCLSKGLMNRGKAAAENSLSALKSRHSNTDKPIELTDIRVLVAALQNAMTNSPKQRGSTPQARHLLTSEGLPRKVHGKHVIASIGSRGVVWCGPKESLKLTRPGLSHQTDGVTEIDDVTAIKHFEAVFISETKIVHASGAGDAFCAGVVNAMLRDECRELDSVCIEEGLRVARAFLESDINSK